MSGWGAVTWDVARAGGFVAYGLVTLSIVLGLVLSLRWRNTAWPRWATNDLHRYVTLLALVFTLVHTLAVWIDPFMAFGPSEILVPLASHYRPVWVALGIVASYLLVAIWLSERVQRLIGYAWWRRLHYLTFAIYGLVTVHGIGTGSDTRAGWALAIYGGSLVLIGILLAVRLLWPGPHMKPQPEMALTAVGLTALLVLWMSLGPLRSGWNATANNGHGSGARLALAGSSGVAGTGGTVRAFDATLQGTMSQSGIGGEDTVQLDGSLSGGLRGSLRIVLQGQVSGDGSLAVSATRVEFSPAGNGSLYLGRVTSMTGSGFDALVTGLARDRVRLNVLLRVDPAGNVTGTVQGRPA